jgi:PAS domain S-box-containing protein
MKDDVNNIAQPKQQFLPIGEDFTHINPSITPSPALSFDDLMQELQSHKLEMEKQIEELKYAQDSLQVSRNYYVDLYEFAPIGYVSLHADGKIAEINRAGAKLLGMERNNLSDQHFEQFIVAEHKHHWLQLCSQTKQTHLKQSIELPIRKNNSVLFYAHFDCLYKEASESAPTLHIIFTDITERKKAEEELRIAAVTFHMQEGIVVANAKKSILRVNHAFSRITGYSAKEAIGNTPSFLRSGLHDRAFYRELWASVIKDGYWQGEIWNKRKNGELFPVWQTITAVVGADKTVTHYVGSFTDITVQKQAEKVLLDARDRLEIQVVNTKDELEKIKAETAEINTTLNVILKRRESDRAEAQITFSQEVESTILPLIKKLKNSSNGRIQSSRLLGILETSLEQLGNSYGRTASLASVYQKLTPIETQVASMIRQGLPTKVIASALNNSIGTVNIHRKHIRKKLELDGKSDNLHSFLKNLTE